MRRWCAGAVVLASVVLAGCGSSGGGATARSAVPTTQPAHTTTSAHAHDTSGPTSASGSAPATSSIPPLPTLAPTSDAPTSAASTSVAPTSVVDDVACALAPADPAGTVTFVRDGRLWSTDPDGSSTQCLLEVGDVSGRVQWSSAADRVLLGPATVADGSGTRASGFFTDNAKVAWSTPTGKALIAPRAADGRLVWRSSTNAGDRLDVSFMQHTDFAAYHPSGKAIAATGIGLDGTPGVYIATNRGVDPQAIARLETPNSTLTELSFGMSGRTLFFIHHHDDTGDYHVHRLALDGLFLSDVAEAEGTASHLTASTVDDETVAWQVAVDGQPLRLMASVDGAAPVAVVVAEGVDAEPVGWLSGGRLVARTQPAGSAPGTPGDLWVWSAGAAPVHVAGTVAQAAVRVVQGPFVDPPNRVEAQAPG